MFSTRTTWCPDDGAVVVSRGAARLIAVETFGHSADLATSDFDDDDDGEDGKTWFFEQLVNPLEESR